MGEARPVVADQTPRTHRRELEETKWGSIYRLFNSLEEAGAEPASFALLQKETAAFVELVIAQELRVSNGVFQAFAAITQLGKPLDLDALAAWRSALGAACPSRKGVRLVLNSFDQWLNQVTPDARPSFLQMLPQIAPCIPQLGAKGMQDLLQAASAVAAPDDLRTVWSCVGAYGSTTGPAILAACRIAQRAVAWGERGYIERVKATILPERLGESRDAERLLPALAQLSDSCADHGQALWCDAFDLILTLAGANYSSAYVVARDLPKRLRRCPPDAALLYVEDFHRLVGVMGIRVAGFGLNDLPKLYRKCGLTPTRAFVEAARATAEAYGVTAGQWFCEQKTEAARNVLHGNQFRADGQ
jgi:hypothetical protein